MTASYPTGSNSASDSSENSTKVDTSFDIRDHLDKLTPTKEKDKYICPVCGSHNLGINSKNGKYYCFDSECDKADIREAIKPWAEVLAEREAEKNKSGSQKPKKKVVTAQKAIPLTVTAPIPTGLKLLKLPAPQQGPEPQKPKFFPKGVHKDALQITYSYSPTQEVLRYQWLDSDSPKGRSKTYRQTHIDGNGKRVWTKGDSPWPAYRLDEVVETLKSVPNNEPVAVLMLEGEPNVELARSHSIAALTMQGSNWNHSEMSKTVDVLQATGKQIVLVMLRDNDDTGIKKASEVQSLCNWALSVSAGIPCLIIDPRAIYPDIPNKGDIQEILENMDIEEFIQRLEAEIHATTTEEINENPLTDRDRSEHSQASHISELGGEIEKLLQSDLKKSQLQLKISEIALRFRINSADVWKIYRELEQESEQEANKEDTRIGVEQLLASKSASVKLSEIFPASLAGPIEEVARRMNLKPECYALALISGVSRFLKNGSSTMLVEEWNRYRCRTFGYFGAFIAESSQMKTPVLNAMITDPLAAMRQKNQEKFNAQEKAYKEELEQWKNSKDEDKGPAPDAPVETIPYITKATWEGIAGMVGRNPIQGILWLCDELAGFFKSANQYRSGKGSDKEDLLECWSGNGAVVARAAGTTVNVGAVSLSIYGNIQPKVLEPFLGDGSDDNGTFARFDFVQQPPALTQITLGLSKIDINPMLQALYERVDAIPMMQFELDEEARKLFVDYYNHCQRLRLNHPKQGMRAMLGKAAEKVGRVATILHCIHAAHSGIEVSPKIPASQVAAAIKWVEYTTQQALSINIEVSSPDALESNLAKIISLAERNGGVVSVREVSKTFNGKHRKSNQEIQEWFAELATMNYGEVTSKGRSILFSLTYVSPMSPIGYNLDTVSVTIGDTPVPTMSPIPPLSDTVSPSNQSNGDNWGHIGDTPVPNSKTMPNIGLSSNGDIGDTFTPSPKTSQSSMMSCTTESAQPQPQPEQPTPPTQPKTVTLKKGLRVRYVGDNANCLAQYGKLDLVVDDINKHRQVACLKPDGSFTTWLNSRDLRAISD